LKASEGLSSQLQSSIYYFFAAPWKQG